MYIVLYCNLLVWFGLDRIVLYCCGGGDNKLILTRPWSRLWCGCGVVVLVAVVVVANVQVPNSSTRIIIKSKQSTRL